jgi:hypothetical protein
MNDVEQAEHAETLAKIESRKAAFNKSPFWFTAWDISTKVLHIAFWVAFWSIVAQCTCSGCIWGRP